MAAINPKLGAKAPWQASMQDWPGQAGERSTMWWQKYCIQPIFNQQKVEFKKMRNKQTVCNQ